MRYNLLIFLRLSYSPPLVGEGWGEGGLNEYLTP